MPALDFPALPAVNQQFPVTPIAGLPQYTWDGEKWTTVGAQISNAVPASALPLMDATPAVVGVTTKYAREDHIHPTDTTRADVNAVLLKVPQGLSTTEQTDIRKNVYAAPFDAMAYNGMQINGAMEVSQELGTSPTLGSNKYVCDGWKYLFAGTMSVSGQVTLATPISLLFFSIGAAQTSLGVNDYATVYHRIEGYRVVRLRWGTTDAQPITITFWTSHTRTGIYSVAVRNGNGDRSYAATYTQNASGILQYNTVTIPGCVNGTWDGTNGAGIDLFFSFAAGTNSVASVANTWLNAGITAAPGQINAVAATSDVFRLTGVVVLPGIEAPSAARSALIMRPYDQELVTCKRYWTKIFKKEGTNGSPMVRGMSTIYFPVSMRAAPTVMSYTDLNGNATKLSVDGVHNIAPSSLTFPYATTDSIGPDLLLSAPATIWVAGSFTFDARL